MKLTLFFSIFFLAILFGCSEKPKVQKTPSVGPPEELYGQLFYDVQSLEIFKDSKTFVDCIPLGDLDSIKSEYALIKNKSPEALLTFVKRNFSIPGEENSSVDSLPLSEHISALWKNLKRPANEKQAGTLLPLPYPYTSAGGNFRELHYWDSYFTMLGLQADGDMEALQNTVDNFAWLINKYGFVPAGNRSYYLTRSQPPVFALMLSVLVQSKGDSIYKKYIPELEKEYAFWMQGSTQLEKNVAGSMLRVVKLAGGEIMNRYWDEATTPRAEHYSEDVKAAREASLVLKQYSEKEMYRNIRAAAESGWEGSSRWIDISGEHMYSLATIHTTDFIPVDLNCLLYYEELVMAHAYNLAGNTSKSREFDSKAADRMEAIHNYCWNDQKKYYLDFDFKTKKNSLVYSLAGTFPLFFQIASPEQAAEVEKKVNTIFLREGGLAATAYRSGQLWDSPYGYAPLQWMAIKGLRNYKFDLTADLIKSRWLNLNAKVYKTKHAFFQKYDVTELSTTSAKDENSNPGAFGWSIGVYQKLSREK